MHKDLDTLRRALFLTSVPMFFVTFALPIKSKQFGASALEIGLLFSLFTACILVLRPLVGVGVDRIGRRPFFLFALATYMLASAGYAVAESLPVMYAARLVQGLGASFLLITVDVITTDLTTPPERSIAMGRNMEIQTRASLVGAFIGFTLIGIVPAVAWKGSFGVFTVLAAAGLAYAWVAMPESRIDLDGELPSSRDEGAVPIAVEPGSLPAWLAVVAFAGFAGALIQPLYLIYLQDRFDPSVEMLAWAFLPAGIVFAVLPSYLARAARRFGPVRSLCFGLCASGFIYPLLPHLAGLLPLILLYTLAAVGWALAEPARKAISAMFAGSRDTGRTFGTVELFAGLGATLGPIVGGWSYDTLGHEIPFYINSLVLILAVIVAVLVVPMGVRRTV